MLVRSAQSPSVKHAMLDCARGVGASFRVSNVARVLNVAHVSNAARVSTRGTLLIRNIPLLGPYSRTIPRVIW